MVPTSRTVRINRLGLIDVMIGLPCRVVRVAYAVVGFRLVIDDV
jgi:uncharacterized membrane protein YuzA (DUF378 family)